MLLAAAQLAEELLDALTELDAQTAPLGLYACEEFGMAERPFPRLHPEWNRAIAPRLKALGGEPGYANLRDGEFTFTLPTGERAELQIVRLSKIKVRKFGSAYRIDNHTSFRERWQALRLDQTLKAVGNHRDGLPAVSADRVRQRTGAVRKGTNRSPKLPALGETRRGVCRPHLGRPL